MAQLLLCYPGECDKLGAGNFGGSMDLSELAQEAMKRQGLTQAGLAKELGISPAAVGKMVRGESKKTSHGVMVKLAQLAGVELTGSVDMANQLRAFGIPEFVTAKLLEVAKLFSSEDWQRAVGFMEARADLHQPLDPSARIEADHGGENGKSQAGNNPTQPRVFTEQPAQGRPNILGESAQEETSRRRA